MCDAKQNIGLQSSFAFAEKVHQESFRNENHLHLISVPTEHHNYFVMNFDLIIKKFEETFNLKRRRYSCRQSVH